MITPPLESTRARRLFEAICCPRCGGALVHRGAKFRCSGCSTEYGNDGGVIELLADPSLRDAKTDAFYNVDDARRYGREKGTMGERIARPVRQFIEATPSDHLLVEIGAGRGAFAGSHPGYVPTDLSLNALRQYFTGVRIQLDATRLPFRTGSLDAIFSVATLEHVPEPAKALAEIHRCLRPGGRALVYPAWFVRPWASRSLHVRGYEELGPLDRLRKASIPVRENRVYRLAAVLPRRLGREILIRAHTEVAFGYRRLTPNMSEYVASDSDAYASMDPHAASAFFVSRGYHDVRRPTALRRLAYQSEPVVVARNA